MRKLVVLSAMMLLSGCASTDDDRESKIEGVNFDGIYMADLSNEEYGNYTTTKYLRFYDDGCVIVTNSTGSLNEIANWFHRDWSTASGGIFSVENDRMEFSIIQGFKVVDYWGGVDEDKIVLNFRIRDEGKQIESLSFSFFAIDFENIVEKNNDLARRTNPLASPLGIPDCRRN